MILLSRTWRGGEKGGWRSGDHPAIAVTDIRGRSPNDCSDGHDS